MARVDHEAAATFHNIGLRRGEGSYFKLVAHGQRFMLRREGSYYKLVVRGQRFKKKPVVVNQEGEKRMV